jgi:uncharacterized protein YbbK (DUF523 family)
MWITPVRLKISSYTASVIGLIQLSLTVMQLVQLRSGILLGSNSPSCGADVIIGKLPAR